MVQNTKNEEFKPSECVLAVCSYNAATRKLKNLLGTGFLISNQVALTAKHILSDYDKDVLSLKIILIDRIDGIHIFDTEVLQQSEKYDIVALNIAGIEESPFLEMTDSSLFNNHDYLTVEYSETSFNQKQGSKKEEVTFRPSTRKGNIVKSYVSEFPEKTPTKVLEVSFPVLQGASGAPLMENKPPWRVAGMITHNVQYQLMPAQIVSIIDGDDYIEETQYFLPTGKAIDVYHLKEFIAELLYKI